VNRQTEHDRQPDRLFGVIGLVLPDTAAMQVRRDSEGALRYGAATDRRKDLTTASKQ